MYPEIIHWSKSQSKLRCLAVYARLILGNVADVLSFRILQVRRWRHGSIWQRMLPRI